MKKTEGTVTMSLEAYNELHEKLVNYEKAFKIRKGYSDTELQVDIDMETFRPLLEEKAGYIDDCEKYAMRKDFYTNNCTIAELIEGEEDHE